MKIKLINTSQYNELKNIQSVNTILTYQNKGYDNFNRDKMNESDKIAEVNINEILKKHINNFVRFQNFKIDKNNDIVIRFQYIYCIDTYFQGVGHIKLDELLNGFSE